jgi:hypothetical protein
LIVLFGFKTQTNKNKKKKKKKETTTTMSSSSEKIVYKSSIGSFLAFNFIVAPICLFTICIALGGLLALVEGWRLVDGFYFIACDVCGTISFFTPTRALTTFGEIMEIVISIIASRFF